ncbi:MAG: hypothetical protein GY829_05760, partial [Gammaproteobacteria bacterium]|nr:hypothetical protein [Gammaproteobacteria bacterium]
MTIKIKKIARLVISVLITSYSYMVLAEPGTPAIAWMPDVHESGSVNVKWNMWWGENANDWKLTVNNLQHCEGTLQSNGNKAQKDQCDINLTAGVHELQVELCNESGCTSSVKKSISVNSSDVQAIISATPAKPTIAWMPVSYQLNGDSVDIDLTWNMWWGVNGNHWKLLLDDEIIHTDTLNAQANQSAQMASTQISLNNTGNYQFSVKLCNGEGSEEVCSSSNTQTISVTTGSTDPDTTDPDTTDPDTTDPDTTDPDTTDPDTTDPDTTDPDTTDPDTTDPDTTDPDTTDPDTTDPDTTDPDTTDPDTTDPDTTSNWPLQEHNVAYNNTSGKVVASYFVEWGIYGRDFHVTDIPASNLTHILYGFIAICGENNSALPGAKAALNIECADQPDDTVTIVERFPALEKSYPGDQWDDPIRGNFGQLIKLKQQVPSIKILPSIGGWTLSDPFYHIVNDPYRRATFVASAIDFIKQYDFFDGIDIDWEFPGGGGANANLGSPDDAQGFADLMLELRTALDVLEMQTGRSYELTAAMNVSQAKVSKVDYQQAIPYMDYIFAMSYDFYGAWSNVTGHHSAVYPTADGSNSGLNVYDGVTNLINAGIPASKIVVGASMYGRGWKGVQNGQGNGPIDGTWEAGVLDYKDIEVNYLGGVNGQGINGFEYFYDETAQAPYIFRESTGELISYDNPRSIKAKGEL